MKSKKIIAVFLAALFVFSVAVLCACSGDDTLPRKYTVQFVTNADGFSLPSAEVREGYRVTGASDLNDLTYPGTEPAVFRGWYSDEECTQRWDIDAYRVAEDMTLYAKWSFPQAYPTEIDMSSDAFSKTICWLQADAGATVSVTLKQAKVTESTAVDPQTGEIFEYEVVTYPDDAPEISLGGQTVTEGYNVSFTVDEDIAGGIYQATIVCGGQSATARGLRFKGTGSQIDPYLVYSEEDLLQLTTRSYAEGTYAVLKSDVTLHSVYADKRGCVYNGVFDGNGKTVYLRNNSGLFYELGEKGEMYDVKFSGAVSGGDPSIGVAANYNAGYIHHVVSTAVSVTSQGGKVNDFSTLSQGGAGGIVGTNKASGEITLCTITSGQANVISGKIAVGGIAGVNYGKIYNFNSTVTPCSAIVGAYNGTEISSTVSNSFAGGAVGVNFGEVSQVNVDGKINCRRIDLSLSNDVGATNVGGVVGYNARGGTIDQCLFQGMRCVGDTNVGGIVGFNDGTVTNCFTGRRVRRPSATTLAERQFISPVIGSFNVGGICGKCGEHSVVSNVFSTANVWSYGMQGYTVAEKADNAIGVSCNQNPRLVSNYLGQKYGAPYSNDLAAPQGDNVLVLDNSERVGSVENNLLGAAFVGGKNVASNALIVQYLTLLGDKFGYNNTYGISLLWQSPNTKGISAYIGE